VTPGGGHTQAEQCLDLEAQSVEYMDKEVISPKSNGRRSGGQETSGRSGLSWIQRHIIGSNSITK